MHISHTLTQSQGRLTCDCLELLYISVRSDVIGSATAQGVCTCKHANQTTDHSTTAVNHNYYDTSSGKFAAMCQILLLN